MRPTTAISELICIRPKGRRVAVTVAIGHPYPTSEGDWGCPVAMTGLAEGTATIHGHDSLQVLCLAIIFIRTRLTAFVADGGRILLSATGEEFPMDSYFASTRTGRKPRRSR